MDLERVSTLALAISSSFFVVSSSPCKETISFWLLVCTRRLLLPSLQEGQEGMEEVMEVRRSTLEEGQGLSTVVEVVVDQSPQLGPEMAGEKYFKFSCQER